MGKHIIVVGSGIIGASLAWYLARGGAKVTVIEERDTGGLATRASWAWINASWGNPLPYFRLRQRSMAEWRELEREVPGLSVNWCGGLIWDLEPAALAEFARQHSAWGYAIREVKAAEIAAIEPELADVPEYALHAASEGVIEPQAAVQSLIEGARQLGVEVLANSPVNWLIEDDSRIGGVATGEGPIHGDETVVAAGAGSAALLNSAGISLRMSQPAGLLAHSRPVGDMLRGLVMAPGLHMRQTAGGRIVAGTDFAGADPEGDPEAMAADLMARAKAMLKRGHDIDLDFHTVGFRPTPADGFPAIGRPRGRAGLYTIVTHSGITLAPALGRFAAGELLDGQRHPLLEPFHPDRPALT